MKKILGILAAFLVMALPLVTSDSAQMTVSVGSTAPTVDNIVIDGQDSGAAVSPNAGTTRAVSVVAEASDNNGHGDISSVICTITGLGTVEDSPVALSAGGIIDTTTRSYTGSFNMDFYDASGSYTVDCEATDASAGTGDRQELFNYNQLTALELDASTIAFGSMNPTETTTVSGDINMLTDLLPTIQNYGNVQIDSTISGTDLSDGGSNEITVDNADYQFTALGFKTLTTGGTTETGLDLAAGVSSVTNVDFRLYVPPGTVNAAYTGTVTVTAVSG